MKTILYTTLAIGALWFSGCTGSRIASNTEVDDVYATSADYKADAAVYATVDDAPNDQANRNSGNTSTADDYDQGYSAKNAERRGEYIQDEDQYAEDDYYYSRRLRRFNTRGYNYYDPYFAYDPYYAIGTPTWAAYSNTPWWYDPYYYNGPSFSWTYNWGAPGNAFYSSYYAYNRPWWDRGWAGYNNGWGGGWNNGWGGGYNSFGYTSYYGGGFGGYGGNYWSGGYNPCGPGFGNGGYGNGGFGGTGGGWGGNNGTTSTTSYGPRNNMSSFNTNNNNNGPRPAKYENPRSVRPYQGNYPLNSTVTNLGVNGNPSTARPTRGTTPVNNSGNIGATPRTNTNSGTPARGTTEPSTYSTPRNSDTYTRPATGTETPRNYTRPSTTTPRSVTPSRSTTPRNVTPSRSNTPRNVTPSRSATPSRNYNQPSRSSTPSRSVTPSRSSSPSSGSSTSSPSRSSGSSSGSRSSSGGGRRR
jgi:hypothetical protein